MALGDNMKRKMLIPTNEEELKRHEISVDEIISSSPTKTQQDELEEDNTSVKKIESETNPVASNNPTTEKNEEVSIEFKPSLRTKVNKINITIRGKLNIYNIHFVKTHVLEKCGSFANVEILLKNIEDLDITFIQFSYYFIEDKKYRNQIATFDIEKPSSQILSMLYLNNYTDLFIRKKLA